MDQDTSTKPEVAAAANGNGSPAWPGAFKVYGVSKQAIKPNAWTLVAVYVSLVAASLFLGAIIGSLTHSSGQSAGLKLLQELISLVVGAVGTGALTTIWLGSTKGARTSYGEALNTGFAEVLRMFVLLFFMDVLLTISFILLIVPFLFVLPRVILAPYFLLDKDLGPVEALQASWEQTKGHAGKVWGIIGVGLLMALLMITIIGIPFAIYLLVMYSAATAFLYRHITGSAGLPKQG